jgi:hypothetical protein
MFDHRFRTVFGPFEVVINGSNIARMTDDLKIHRRIGPDQFGDRFD